MALTSHWSDKNLIFELQGLSSTFEPKNEGEVKLEP
jgi:hypothetical protein